jgi:hypothetical protein
MPVELVLLGLQPRVFVQGTSAVRHSRELVGSILVHDYHLHVWEVPLRGSGKGTRVLRSEVTRRLYAAMHHELNPQASAEATRFLRPPKALLG